MSRKLHERWHSQGASSGIQARLFLLIGLVLLPIVFLLVWTNYHRFQSLRQNVLRNEVEIAQGLASTFATFVNGVQKQLVTTGQAMLGLSPYTQAQANQLLAETATLFPTIRHLSWVRHDGMVLASNLAPEVGRNIAGHPCFQEIRAGHPWVISDLFQWSLTDEPIFLIVTSIRDDTGDLQGMIVAGIAAQELGVLTLHQQRPEGGVFIIFDRQGALVFFGPNGSFSWEDRLRWPNGDPPLQRALATGESQAGIITPALLEGEWLSARVPITGLGYYAGASRPAEVAFAPVRRTMIHHLSFAALIVSAAFLFAFTLARGISGPLRRLEKDAQWMVTGEIPTREDRRAPRELRSLRTTVTTMAASLLTAKESAEDTNRTKSEFLANMSHELRTPMTVIMGSLEFLQQSASAPEERQLLDLASTSAHRLLAIIDDLLDISKIEAGRLKIEERPFDLRACIRHTVEMFAGQGTEKRVRLTWHVAPDVPARIDGDPNRLSQVLVNLVGNAVKFTERGEIDVEVATVDEKLAISVRDTGIGIPADKINRLFQPFVQADSSSTRRYGGTGLGLAISRELVELMGGAIGVESQEGQGSTFSFTMPLRTAEQFPKAPAKNGDRGPVQRLGRVLLVEDDPAVRDLVKILLEQRGLEVRLAENGRQAVARWQEGGINLIFMDIQMPEIDGLEATRQIRELEGVQKKTRIVAMTAHVRQEDRQRCLAAGMDGFLAKPIRPEELDSLVEKLYSKDSE